MQPTNLLAILSTVAAAQAYIVPTGLADGLYAVRLNETGQLHAYPVDLADLPDAAAPSATKREIRHAPSLTRRDQSGCTGHDLNHSDTDNAVAQLQQACGNGKTYPQAIWFHTVGGTIAYTCDYSGGQSCFASEDSLANTQISAKCGQYRSGWWLFGSNKNYGYDVQGASICSNL
ncbi:hypothetical protein B0J18DRAFT_494010 [Chaetomium sp. MPI-SDFR-AT-0129]|nr:hypothetical protein B0J18DRAFT_494010 [Chaetomium sp. MPI-SDFR-AT-0129]